MAEGSDTPTSMRFSPDIATVVTLMRTMSASQRGEVLGYVRRVVAETSTAASRAKRCPVIDLAAWHDDVKAGGFRP